jgi:hypothetical protein
MSTIEADLRMANYWGLMSRSDLIENGPQLDLANLPAVDPSYSLPAELTGYAGTINECGAMWAVKLPAYIEATDSYTLGCPAEGADGAVAGSDTLTIRRASTQQIATGTPLTDSAGQIKLQTSRVQGTLFSTATLPAGYLPPLSETRALVVNGYYVSQNSDERDDTPSLRRKQLDVEGGAPTIADLQIVPGVEDLQIELGVDFGFNADQNADYYVQPGTAIPAGDQVVAARVWLLVRAEQPEQGYTDGRTYDYASRTGANVLTPGDNFRRLLVSKTIALRNTRR